MTKTREELEQEVAALKADLELLKKPASQRPSKYFQHETGEAIVVGHLSETKKHLETKQPGLAQALVSANQGAPLTSEAFHAIVVEALEKWVRK